MRKSFKAILSVIFCFILVSSTMVVSLAALGNISNLKATNVTHNSATITWSAASGADGYELSYTTGSTTKKVTIKGKNTTSYKLTLTPGKSYTVKVKSYDKLVLKTTYGKEYSVTVKAVPVAVTNFKATNVAGGKSVKLSWTKVSGATGYVVQQYKNSKWTNIKVTTGSSYTVSSLTPGTTYKFRVAAYVKYSGKNVYSSYVSLSATPTYLAPTSLKVTNTTTSSVKLSWGAVSGAKKYQVYNYNTKKYNYSSTNSITLSGLEAGTAYKVRVRGYASVNGKNVYGTYTSYLSFTTVTDKVTGLEVSDLTATSVNLSFDKQANAGGYQVFLYDYATKKETRLVAKLADNTYAIDGLKPGSTYRIGVRSYVYNSAYYYSAKSYIYIDTPPVLEAGAQTTESKIELQWTEVRKATSYTIERFSHDSYEWELLAEMPIETPYGGTTQSTNKVSFIDESAGKNKGHIYRVKAYNGETLINEAESEVTTSGVAVEKDNYAVTITWTALNGAETYKVCKYTKGQAGTIIETVITDPNANSYTVNLAPNDYFRYKIIASGTNAAGTVADIMVKSAPLVIDSSDASKTAQLLMLVNAVNKTKNYRGDYKATIETATDVAITRIDASESSAAVKFAIAVFLFGDDPFEAIEAGFNGIVEGKNLDKFLAETGLDKEFGEPETETENLVFKNGVEETSNRTMLSYMEPSDVETAYAYLYNASDASAWKKGFSSVSTTYYPATGKYKVVVKIKAEKIGSDTGKTDAPYHSGFFSMGKAINSLSGGGVGIEEATLGVTTITAYIDAEGRIYNYKIVAPMDIKLGLTEESFGTMKMTCDFDTTISYKIYY